MLTRQTEMRNWNIKAKGNKREFLKNKNKDKSCRSNWDTEEDKTICMGNEESDRGGVGGMEATCRTRHETRQKQTSRVFLPLHRCSYFTLWEVFHSLLGFLFWSLQPNLSSLLPRSLFLSPSQRLSGCTVFALFFFRIIWILCNATKENSWRKKHQSEGREERRDEGGIEVWRRTERTVESVVVGKVGLLLLLAPSLSGVPISEMSVH